MIRASCSWSTGKFSSLLYCRNQSESESFCSYDKCGQVVPTAGACNVPQTKSKKHFRSSSCDVKMIRSFAKDHNVTTAGSVAADAAAGDKYRNLKKLQSHTRNHSTDLNPHDVRHKTLRDDPTLPIRYIQNQLRPQECAEEDDDDELTTGCGHFVKKHSRNHSYDQIYMPNNIRFDADFLRHPHHSYNPKKNVNLLKNVVCDASKVKNSNEQEAAVAAAAAGSRSHSRNNSKDLNRDQASLAAIEPAATGISILRHRRTNSRELNYSMLPPDAVTNVTATVQQHPHQHARNISHSHQKIQIDDDRNELINDDNDEEDESTSIHL